MTSGEVIEWIESQLEDDFSNYNSKNRLKDDLREVSDEAPDKRIPTFLYGSEKTPWKGWVNNDDVKTGISFPDVTSNIDGRNTSFREEQLRGVRKALKTDELDEISDGLEEARTGIGTYEGSTISDVEKAIEAKKRIIETQLAVEEREKHIREEEAKEKKELTLKRQFGDEARVRIMAATSVDE